MSKFRQQRVLPPLETRAHKGADVLVLLGLAAFVSIAFYEVIFLGRVFFFRDFAFFFYPKRVLAAEAVRNFAVPYWESFGGCGTPLLGSLQAAVFYPPALIYYVFPMPWSFMVFVVLHFFISGAGAYYLLRAWGVRRTGATFGAFAWAFSPAFTSTVDNVSFMNSLAWLPWCLLFARRIHQGRRAVGFVWLAVVFAMTVLAGAPEPVMFAGAVVAAYAGARFCGDFFRGRQREALLHAGITSAGLLVGMMLAGMELAPFLYTLRHSARQEPLDMTEAGGWSAAPSDVLLWFLPRFYLASDRGGIYWRSQHWLKTVYLGVIVPVLALWTALAVRRRRNVFFIAIAAVFILLGLGSHSFLWRILYAHLPGFALIRYPVKFYLPAALAIAVLAAFGVDDALALARKGRRTRLRSLWGAAFGLAALFGAAYLVMVLWENRLFVAFTPPVYLSNEVGIDQAVEMFYSARWSFGRSAVILAVCAAALLVVLAASRARMSRRLAAVASLLLAFFADLALFGAHLNPLAGPQIYTDPPAHLDRVPTGAGDHRLYMDGRLQYHFSHNRLDRIQNAQGLMNYLTLVRGRPFESPEEVFAWLLRTSAPRFASVQELDNWLRDVKAMQFVTDVEYELAKETFIPNINLMYHVPMTDTFDPLMPARHERVVDRLKNGALAPGRERFLLDMWGASETVYKQLAPPAFEYAPTDSAGARAVLAENIIAADGEDEALATLLSTPIDLTRRIVLEGESAQAALRHLGPAAAQVPPGPERPGTARVVGDTGNLLAIEVDAARPAVLFLSDCFFPLFAASVDGAEAPLWRANYAYRAVPVPAGKHRVEFRYRPYDFYAGLAASLLAAAFLAAVRLKCPQRGGRPL